MLSQSLLSPHCIYSASFLPITRIPHLSAPVISTCLLSGRYQTRARNLTCCPVPSIRPGCGPLPPYTPRVSPRWLCSTSRQSTKLQAVLGEANEMDAYAFPDGRLKKKMDNPSKTPLLLIACGSFSPITFLHLRMFVMAGDYVKHNTEYEVVGGYLSPVSDAYRKQGLAPAEHR